MKKKTSYLNYYRLYYGRKVDMLIILLLAILLTIFIAFAFILLSETSEMRLFEYLILGVPLLVVQLVVIITYRNYLKAVKK